MTLNREQFTQLLDKAIHEVDVWKKTSDKAKYFDDWHIDGYKWTFEKAKKFKDLDDLEEKIRNIHHAICDSGPMSADFAPSFRQLVGYFQKLEKKRRKRAKKHGFNP